MPCALEVSPSFCLFHDNWKRIDLLTDIVDIQPDNTIRIAAIHMARKSIKREQPPTYKLPSDLATTEQSHIEHPVSSGDTIAMDFDVIMADGLVDEGYHTNHEIKKTGKF